MSHPPLHESLAAESFLEYAFLRWVLTPAVRPDIAGCVVAQQIVETAGHRYRVDYELRGQERRISVELDGYAFHSDRAAFSYDRMRQNDLVATGRTVLRFSYDAIRRETARCVAHLQAALAQDPLLATYLVREPRIEQPEMDPDPDVAFRALRPQAGQRATTGAYFALARTKIDRRPLRQCQVEAFVALANYFRAGGTTAACVMSVGAGKTALGVLACLAFATRRALILTPGSVIRGTFDRAFDHQAVGNALYGLPGGPLIPGCPPPRVLTLDREEGAISGIARAQLLAADVIITNFHSLGTGDDRDDLLAKLRPEDIDLIVVDEAHIAAADSYRRAFRHFAGARTLLMSACFQRLDGRPIDADVVYRYRLIDAIADGNAKNLRVQRFAPDAGLTTYEMVWPDGRREEIVGKEALLALIRDERMLARITAKSHAPIRQVLRAVKEALVRQAALLHPVKPRVLFSALGERHAEQIALLAEEQGIPCASLHHAMPDARIRAIRARFEQDSGNLQGIVQLKMLGQGYDFPPITVVVPLRPYGSFGEFYQFVGRGIRVLTHPALAGRVGPADQYLDLICHAELGLDEHIETIYRENDMDPVGAGQPPWRAAPTGQVEEFGVRAREAAERPETFVLFEHGRIEQRVVHDQQRVEQRKAERELEALAQRYAAYAQSSPNPITFEQFAELMRRARG
jgi:superfamily II DNA or RNA helicase/very-short-patch-repair endonuclease